MVNSVSQVFNEKEYFCIKVEQVRLWMFLLEKRRHLGCPWQLRNMQESNGLLLPEGAKWTKKPANVKRSERIQGQMAAMLYNPRPLTRLERMRRENNSSRADAPRPQLG